MSTSETDILADLLKELRLVDENEQKIRTAEETAARTDNEAEKQTAKEEADNLRTAVRETRQRIKSLRERLDKLNVDKNADSTVPPPMRSSSSISFKLPQPEKYKRGENFHLFCENFIEYVTLSKFDNENLPLLFLQLVDEQTKAKLKLINLDADQRRDARKFLEIYERKMAPAHESRTFKSMLADLSQKNEETIEEFSYRIFSIASRAYSDDEKVIREEACYNTFMRGISDPYIKRKLHEDPSLDSFERATEEASRLETISRALQPKHDSTEIDEIGEDLVHAIDDHQDGEQNGNSHEERQAPRDTYRRKNQFQTSKYHNSKSRDTTAPQSRRDGYSTNSNPTNNTLWNHNNRTKKGEPIHCYKCGGPNHIAKHCRATLN